MEQKLRSTFIILSLYRVTRWAETLGDELWELAEKVARPEELLSVSLIFIRACIYVHT